MRLACSMAAARISSVVSLSVARAEPSARTGIRPRVMRHCRAGASPLHDHVRLSAGGPGGNAGGPGGGGRCAQRGCQQVCGASVALAYT